MNALEDALYDTLAAHAGLTALVSTRIYRQAAPQGATLPYVLYELVAGGDENSSPVDSQDLRYRARGVSATSSDEAGDIDDQIRAALHRQALTVSGWENFWTSRENAFRFTETAEGVRRYHAGASYRVRLDKQ